MSDCQFVYGANEYSIQPLADGSCQIDLYREGRLLHREIKPECPEVTTPGVHYRYPGENWKVVPDADNYSIEPGLGRCDTEYRLEGYLTSASQFSGLEAPCGAAVYVTSDFTVRGKINSLTPIPPQINSAFGVRVSYTPSGGAEQFTDLYMRYGGSFNYLYYKGNFCQGNTSGTFYGYDLRDVKPYRIDGLPDNCGQCIFRILRNGQEIFYREGVECPEAKIVT